MDRGAFFACGVWRWSGMGESRMLVAEKKNHAGVGHGKLRDAADNFLHFLSIILRDKTRSSRVDSTHTHTCGNIFAELEDDDVNFLRRHPSEASSCFLFKSSAGSGGGGGCTFVYYVSSLIILEPRF